ncbi:TraB/GumN family protein [Candidatus Woesearchaeota archaeon]|nr:TraB/GumN family protein [Candidatus Woesearchaeota archaeon]
MQNTVPYQNLTLIGSSHIARESVKEVKETIEREDPEIIAVELDAKRYYGLLEEEQASKKRSIGFYNIKRVGFKGFIFAVVASWAMRKLGKYVEIDPGTEMLVAIKLAKKKKRKLVLIDQDIEITLRRFSETLTWKERWQMCKDVYTAVIKQKPFIQFDITKVPSEEIIRKLMREVKKKYPNIYHVLVEERNEVMAHQLHRILENNPEKKVLAIVGAGHEEGITSILKRLKSAEKTGTEEKSSIQLVYSTPKVIP